MAFGYKTTTGDFLPIVKYDARSGRFFKVDKEPGQTGVDTEVPNGTTFAVDFGTLEAGWVTFGPQGPVRHMHPYLEGGETIPQPQDKDADGKLIFRAAFYVKLAGNALGGIREWIGASAAVMNALDDLWQTFAAAPEAARGQIPLICIASTTAIRSGSGTRASTNYAPVFRIDGWVDRPDALGPRTVPAPRAAGVPISQMSPQAVAQMAAASIPAPAPAPAAAPAPGMPF